MRRYDVISEICDSMLELGWGPYQNDHEDANGQFEMNWQYDDALKTADKHAFFKYMTKSIAEKHGLRATFMPKPFSTLTGNGCHMHISLWSKDGKNLFEDSKDPMGLSKLGYQFIAGLMNSAEALTAITNPTVNSYKRINAPRTTSGATWAPNTVTYTGNNRTHMIRIPDAGRFEFRLADGAANPYAMEAAVLTAGLDGIEQKRDPGERLDIDMYAEGHKVKDAKKLPLNLLDALRALEASPVLRKGLGEPFISAYLKLKLADWNEYAGHLTEWERRNTLDCWTRSTDLEERDCGVHNALMCEGEGGRLRRGRKPQIGKATLFLSGKLLLVNFCEAVNEGDRQYVGDENGYHRLKEGYRASGVLQLGLLLLWLAVGAITGMGCARSRGVVSLGMALALIVLQNSRQASFAN